MATKDYSLTALNEFLAYAGDKGLMKRNTADSRKRTANKILAVLDPAEQADLRAIDMDHAFDLFVNKEGTSYKPDSLQVFRSRLKSALTEFFAYQENPSGYRPTGAQRKGAKKKAGTKKSGSSGGAASPTPAAPPPAKPPEPTMPGTIAIPVPLREGLTVTITNVPADFTANEADRVAAIVKAYAMK